jgi:hypothetical protein
VQQRQSIVRVVLLAVSVFALACVRGETAVQDGSPAALQVHLKLDFDDSRNPFDASGNADVALVDDPAQALTGRSLAIRRTKEGGSFGARAPLQIAGSQKLRVAFVMRAVGMRDVTVNVFDARANDNTTPASRARVADDAWRPVVFAVEDFHHNSDQPDRKIPAETQFASILFHGQDTAPGPVIWIDKVVVYRTPDSAPPAAPAGTRAAAAADGTIALTWEEPADDTFAVVYSVHRRVGAGAWEKIGESLQPRYRDRPQSADVHTYRITAADYENNVSAPSSEAPITPAAPDPASAATPAPPPPWISDRANYGDHVRTIHASGAGKVQRDVFLFAGDSITAAMLYTHTLGSWLARGLTVRQGVGRVTTGYGAKNMAQYLSDARPEFAVIMYGTNDVTFGESIPGAMRNLEAIIDMCIAVGTVPVLSTIPPRDFNPERQGDTARFNRDLVQLARKKRVPVSYAFEEMLKEDLRTILSDGIHLTPGRGNAVAGRALRQTMDQVYFALRDTAGR